jgi:hypothetical protein
MLVAPNTPPVGSIYKIIRHSMKTKSYNGYHTQTGVKLTGRWAEKPIPPLKELWTNMGNRGELGDHHAKVGKCKIDDKHAGCAAKSSEVL